MNPPDPSPSVEFIPLEPTHATALTAFLIALQRTGAEKFFHPHALDASAADRITRYDGADYYCGGFVGTAIVAYGMLRGWDEGFDVPSAGLAVHPDWRSRGIACLAMQHLHAEALSRGARRVRLTVHPANVRAIALYTTLGYALQPDRPDRLVGMRDLASFP